MYEGSPNFEFSLFHDFQRRRRRVLSLVPPGKLESKNVKTAASRFSGNFLSLRGRQNGYCVNCYEISREDVGSPPKLSIFESCGGLLPQQKRQALCNVKVVTAWQSILSLDGSEL